MGNETTSSINLRIICTMCPARGNDNHYKHKKRNNGIVATLNLLFIEFIYYFHFLKFLFFSSLFVYIFLSVCLLTREREESLLLFDFFLLVFHLLTSITNLEW